MKINKSKKIRRIRKYIINLLVIMQVFFVLTMGNLELQAYQFTFDELSIPILTYHKFCIGESPDAYTINIDCFKQQMNFLRENDYRVISISQLLECIKNNFFPEKPAVITIDDGFKSVYNLAFPILKEYGFPATLYLYTDFIDNGPNQLSWLEVKEMIDMGIEIGSHSLSHTNLLNLKQNESYLEYLNRIKKEIFLSKTILERNTGSSVLSFAYPYGVYSQEIKMLAKQAGYKALLNVNNMNNSIPINAYSLNRQIISSNCSLTQFQSIVLEKTLQVNDIFPPDGTVTDNQEITIGAILGGQNIEPTSLYLRLSGSGLLNHTYYPEQQKISFTPIAPKLLQKRTWIAQITARDVETGQQRKISWLFTVR
ncbi:MAG: polysaccharide deacetylase family protein [Atribacterota bacterium]|nr:polysaccharide deacetylase family protein [Atribacterota bacterium]MDD4896131.1 polysaccharide deacetylase family protein [Atribacterota bacterium]MDD5638211.1 polysaccharide deacetylase family protein [Atribacterota bacterium]